MERPQTWRKFACNLLVFGGCLGPGLLNALAQTPAPAPPAPSLPVSSPAIVTSLPSDDALAEAATSREALLEDRIRRLEAMVQGMQGVRPGVEPGMNGVPGSAVAPGALIGSDGPNRLAVDPSRPNASYPRSSGAIAPGQGTPANPPPSDKNNMPAKAFNYPLKGRFGPGFEFRTDDDEYVLQFHNLTQVDFRGYNQGGMQPVKDTFVIPRQWFMFSGRLTKPFEYFVSVQNSIDTVSGLDMFGNIHYDDRMQFKIGRYKTPFTYEFYALPIQGLVQPERSLFFNNFGLNREVGADVWGQLFNKQLDYAAGLFNSSRNGFVDLNDGKAALGFLNWRPFKEHEGSPFEFLNVGGSMMYADGVNPASPLSMRTAVPTSGNVAAGVPFMTFNSNAREAGQRALYDLHAAWYHKSLSLVGEWQSGTQQYALSSNLSQRTRLPVDSYYVQAGYFITGETVSGRNVVNPIRPFDPRKESFGPGAIELTARYNYLVMGPQIFSGGFADPNQNSRSLYTTDLGFNWYMTQNIKWYFTWEHAVFGTPVVYAPGKFQLTNDMFLLRFQVFF